MLACECVCVCVCVCVSLWLRALVCVCVCVLLCVGPMRPSVCLRARVRMYVRAGVRSSVCTRAYVCTCDNVGLCYASVYHRIYVIANIKHSVINY